MSSTFGLSATGFNPKRQADIIADIVGDLKNTFGGDVNLAGDTLFGQIIAILSNPSAQMWEAIEAVYASQYRAGADGIGGIAVDNLMSLIGATRAGAAPTKTDPNPSVSPTGLTVNGLELYGDAGTVIPAGSIILTQTAPAVQFQTDNDVTIEAGANAQQTVTLSAQPTDGAYQLRFIAPSGNALTTPSLNWDITPAYIQAAIANMTDSDGTKPFSDIAVSGVAQQYQILFGNGEPAPGIGESSPGAGDAIPPSPSSGSRGVPIAVLASNTMTSPGGSNVSTTVSINIVQNTEGHATRGVGTATCTQNGAIVLGSGTLTVIGTPTSGWSSVTNPLDCVTGRGVESDQDALSRRDQLLTNAGNATVRAVEAAVRNVKGVTSVTPIANTSLSAVQLVKFLVPATSGTYCLKTTTGVTDPIAFDASAIDVQNALQNLPLLGNVMVLGSAAFGYEVRFNTTIDGLPVPLMAAVNVQTDIAPVVMFTRPGKSIEVVVDGGSDTDVAAAIYAATAGGIETYGSAIATMNADFNAGSVYAYVDSVTQLSPGLSVWGIGIVPGTTILSISGSALVLSQPALASRTSMLSFSHAQQVTDEYGNPQIIQFSRTTKVPFYVVVALKTDLYNTPGNAASGLNPRATFKSTSLKQIQDELVLIGNSFASGSTVIGYGTNGLVGAFNDVPGIIGYTLYFGISPNPTEAESISLFSSQRPLFETSNVSVSFQ